MTLFLGNLSVHIHMTVRTLRRITDLPRACAGNLDREEPKARMTVGALDCPKINKGSQDPKACQGVLNVPRAETWPPLVKKQIRQQQERRCYKQADDILADCVFPDCHGAPILRPSGTGDQVLTSRFQRTGGRMNVRLHRFIEGHTRRTHNSAPANGVDVMTDARHRILQGAG